VIWLRKRVNLQLKENPKKQPKKLYKEARPKKQADFFWAARNF
jgi:hypothetical protein